MCRIYEELLKLNSKNQTTQGEPGQQMEKNASPEKAQEWPVGTERVVSSPRHSRDANQRADSPNFGNNVEQEFSNVVGGNTKWYRHCGKSLDGF